MYTLIKKKSIHNDSKIPILCKWMDKTHKRPLEWKHNILHCCSNCHYVLERLNMFSGLKLMRVFDDIKTVAEITLISDSTASIHLSASTSKSDWGGLKNVQIRERYERYAGALNWVWLEALIIEEESFTVSEIPIVSTKCLSPIPVIELLLLKTKRVHGLCEIFCRSIFFFR